MPPPIRPNNKIANTIPIIKPVFFFFGLLAPLAKSCTVGVLSAVPLVAAVVAAGSVLANTPAFVLFSVELVLLSPCVASDSSVAGPANGFAAGASATVSASAAAAAGAIVSAASSNGATFGPPKPFSEGLSGLNGF